jgi:putative transposase
VRELDRLIAVLGKPGTIGSDNATTAPSWTSNATLTWTAESKVDWRYIDPGRPVHKAVIESFMGYCDEFLNETLFTSLLQAGAALEEWRRDYNIVRRHSRIGWLTPDAYAEQFSMQRGQAGCATDGLRALAPCPPPDQGVQPPDSGSNGIKVGSNVTGRPRPNASASLNRPCRRSGARAPSLPSIPFASTGNLPPDVIANFQVDERL